MSYDASIYDLEKMHESFRKMMEKSRSKCCGAKIKYQVQADSYYCNKCKEKCKVISKQEEK